MSQFSFNNSSTFVLLQMKKQESDWWDPETIFELKDQPFGFSSFCY